MDGQPAIPSLVVIPGDAKSNFASLYAMATAYAHSGLLISDEGNEIGRPEFSFPAVVCSSFAIELFLKFFLALGELESGKPIGGKKVHYLSDLWHKINPKYQAVIAAMYRSASTEPSEETSSLKKTIFEHALGHIGEAPFVKWRYVHEVPNITVMSHAAISEIVSALHKAANFFLRQRSEKSQSIQNNAQADDQLESALDQSNSLPARAGLKSNNSSETRMGATEREGEWESPKRLISKAAGNPIIVQGFENILLGRASPLRQLPVNLNPQQALFFDSLRYTVEFLDICFARLYESLTQTALHVPNSVELPGRFANIFLDAWGVVYSVNRIRIMYMNIPGIRFEKPEPGTKTFLENTKEFQDLRRIADNLAAKAGHIVDNGGGALGELNWLTGVEIEPDMLAWHCTIQPGAFQKVPAQSELPFQSTLGWPTDGIRLALGGIEANLSAVRKHISLRVRNLEVQLSNAFNDPKQRETSVISDFFARREVKVVKPKGF